MTNIASKLDLKKLQSDVYLCNESNRVIREEITKFTKEGLVGERGKKMEEEVSLTAGKLAQLEGKFTWLHQAHKELKKRLNDSLKASQPLMMNQYDTNRGVSEVAVSEFKDELRKLEHEISDLTANVKMHVTDLKSKISEKVDDRNLNELEDQLTTDMDQIIRSM